jgi:hypothetical protein
MPKQPKDANGRNQGIYFTIGSPDIDIMFSEELPSLAKNIIKLILICSDCNVSSSYY